MKLKVTFKDVGQGDSIIIEWRKNSKSYVGIIDCNLKTNNRNPILEHIKILSTKEISFIILSHPHYDHFSGFEDLFNYCEKNKIIIKNFIHTAHANIIFIAYL